jgi:putative transposase
VDAAFAMKEFAMSERRACKLGELDRRSYRYEPRADHNAELREELAKLARQKPRYGYRRLHVLLNKRGHPANAQRIYRLYREERLMLRRLRRKRLVRPASEGRLLLRSNQEWAVDFACDALATGRDSHPGHCRCVYPRVFDPRGRYKFVESESNPSF